MLTGVPKPQVCVPQAGRMPSPEGVRLCGDPTTSAGSPHLITMSGCEQLVHPKVMRGSKATNLGDLWEVGSSQPPNNMQTNSSNITPCLLLISHGSSATRFSCPCKWFENVSELTKIQLMYFFSPEFCCHLTCPFPPTSQLLALENLTAIPLSFMSFC